MFVCRSTKKWAYNNYVCINKSTTQLGIPSDAAKLQLQMSHARAKVLTIQKQKRRMASELKRKQSVAIKLQRRWKRRTKRHRTYKSQVQRKLDTLANNMEEAALASTSLGGKRKLQNKLNQANKSMKREKQLRNKEAKERVYLLLRRKICSLEEELLWFEDEDCQLREKLREYRPVPEWVREMFIYFCVRACVCMYVCMCVYIYLCVRACVRVYIYLCVYVCIWKFVSACVRACVCMCVYM